MNGGEFLDSLLLSAEAMAKLFLVASVGYYFVKRGVLGQEAIGGATRLMIDVIVPSALCVSMVKGFNAAAMVEASPLILLPAIWVTATILAALGALAITRRAGQPPSADRAAAALCGIQNSFYVPLPLVLAVTNREQHPMVYVYIGMVVLAVNPIQWTLGSWLVMGTKENERRHWKESLKYTVNGPVVGVVSGALLSQVPGMAEAARGEAGALPLFRLPLAAMEMVGAAMAPLAMILTGALVAQCRIRHALKLRHVVATAGFRFVVVPVIVLVLLKSGVVPASPLVALVLMVQAAAPPAMNTALVARRYDGEWEVVSALLLVTNLLALIALPVWMAVAMQL